MPLQIALYCAEVRKETAETLPLDVVFCLFVNAAAVLGCELQGHL